MGSIQIRNIDEPDETRTFDKGEVQLVSLGAVTFAKAVFQPGWSWSACVKPIVKTETCMFDHTTFVVSGRLRVRLDDGTEAEGGPGDVMLIPAGHDAWVIGDEAVVTVDFDETNKDYARDPDA